ncbi:hypothetical protein HK097_004969 [Rhizophlyctis rosea]|uniref:Uncharacterized protein n=1 Tax=Rhizophlyctis rosea TaxID=64517 RepID=A0AAD5WX36_9FUNG|nr:hypothetical protein HK097_004969 [Rhizophlyctis rosea]
MIPFALEAGITDDEAVKLINMDPPLSLKGLSASKHGVDAFLDGGFGLGSTGVMGGMVMSAGGGGSMPRDLPDDGQDTLTIGGRPPDSSLPIFSRKRLLALPPYTVHIRQWSKIRKCLRNEYFRVVRVGDGNGEGVDPNDEEGDVSGIVTCKNCFRFFLEEEWTYRVLEGGCCPFCRVKIEIG